MKLITDEEIAELEFRTLISYRKVNRIIDRLRVTERAVNVLSDALDSYNYTCPEGNTGTWAMGQAEAELRKEGALHEGTLGM